MSNAILVYATLHRAPCPDSASTLQRVAVSLSATLQSSESFDDVELGCITFFVPAECESRLVDQRVELVWPYIEGAHVRVL